MPRTLTITIPDDVYKRLEDEAKAKGVTLDDIIAERLGGVWVGGAFKGYARKGKQFEEILEFEEKSAEEGFVSS